MHVMSQLNFRNGVVVLRGESKDQPWTSTLFFGPGVSRPSGFGELMEDYKCLNLTRPMAEQHRAGQGMALHLMTEAFGLTNHLARRHGGWRREKANRFMKEHSTISLLSSSFLVHDAFSRASTCDCSRLPSPALSPSL